MLEKLPTLVHLLKQLQQVPYLASKNMYKIADYFLQADRTHVEKFCHAILQAHHNVKPCERCFCWKESNVACLFCTNTRRNQQLVCVVETWEELLAIEKTKGYEGVYHVLQGVICPLEGIGPENLTIDALCKRVVDDTITEIILATNQTPEGEATAAYIARKLKATGVKISCLARGLPVGSRLDTMDRVTVYKALSERRPF